MLPRRSFMGSAVALAVAARLEYAVEGAAAATLRKRNCDPTCERLQP